MYRTLLRIVMQLMCSAWKLICKGCRLFTCCSLNKLHCGAISAVQAGVSVSAGQRSDVRINPEGEEAQSMREWYDMHGCTAPTQRAGEGLANARWDGNTLCHKSLPCSHMLSKRWFVLWDLVLKRNAAP